jgi:CRP/FNR family transcriptional regulator, cyclic AMP receptor protein
MTSMTTTLAELDFFVDLDADALAAMAGCGRATHIPAAAYLFEQGEPADAFFAVRRGRVAIEVHDPRAGRIVIDTVEAGDVVGWSWLVPPYRWLFDARAVTAVDAVRFDAPCLRQKCDTDPAFGYALLQRVTHLMHERLQATRVRLLDLYGAPR